MARSDLATAKSKNCLEIADTLTVREAFDALRVFLELCWRGEGRPVDEIAFILGGSKWADGSPVDPTLWEDWLVAIGKCTSVARNGRDPWV
jgi:hypothetical protein